MFKAVEKTINFTANDELRPVMCGINFECETSKLKLVSSDGHRLAVYLVKNCEDSYQYFANENFNFILNKKGAKFNLASFLVFLFDLSDFCIFATKVT